MSKDRSKFAASLVDEYLGSRLDAAGNPPGLREAVIGLAAVALASDDTNRLMRDQVQYLTRPGSREFPDAYLADEAAAEDALQRAAAGLRTALARAGKIVNPRPFEQRAAARLRDDPRLAIRAELARVPRPLTRPEALQWSLTPAPWADDRDDQDRWPPPGFGTVETLRFLPGGATALAQVDEGPHAGWTQIGLVESHHTPARRYPDRTAREALIAVGLELADTEPPAETLPFARAPWQIWTTPWQRLDSSADADVAAQRLASGSWPAAALTDAGRAEADHVPTGLGLPLHVLAPIFPLVAALKLEPTDGVCGFSLSDRNGPGLVSRQWHGHLVHDGNYEPLTPAVEGADLLIRPDLFTQLHRIAGDHRLRTGIAVSRRTGPEATTDE